MKWKVLSGVSHAVVILGVIAIVILVVFEYIKLAIFIAIITGIAYILLLVESFFSTEFKALMQIKSMSEFTDYMKKMHDQRPEIKMKLVCYHNETVTTTVQEGTSRCL